MKKLLKYMKPYIKESILSPLLKLLEVCLELCVPLVISAIIEEGIKAGNMEQVIYKSLLLVLFASVGLVFAITAQYFAAKAATGFVSDIRYALFEHVEKLRADVSESLGTSSILNAINDDVKQLQTGVNLFLRLLLRSPLIVGGAAVMALRIDRETGGIILLGIAGLAVIVFTVMTFSIKCYRTVKTRLDNLLRITRDNLFGLKVIRAFRREDSEREKFGRANESTGKAQVKSTDISSLMTPSTYILVNVLLTLILFICFRKVKSGSLSQGDTVALCNYLSIILVELIKLANLIFNLAKSITAGKRIEKILELPTEVQQNQIQTSADTDPIAVRFENVTLNYGGSSVSALENIDFTIKKGEKIGIIGGTGAGKTSIIRLITGFYLPTGGKVTVFGLEQNEQNTAAIRKQLAVALQNPEITAGTVRDTVKWGNSEATDAEITTALEKAEIMDFLNTEGGLDFKISQEGKNLSGGQKQRISIARALVKRAGLLILDDSFSALDFTTEAKIKTGIFAEYGAGDNSGKTLIIVSQRISSLRGTDRILVLDDGHAVGFGTWDELMERCPVFRRIHDSQVKEGEKE